jgi:hypothetical protein
MKILVAHDGSNCAEFPEAKGLKQAGYLCHIEYIEPRANGTCGSHDIFNPA